MIFFARNTVSLRSKLPQKRTNTVYVHAHVCKTLQSYEIFLTINKL